MSGTEATLPTRTVTAAPPAAAPEGAEIRVSGRIYEAWTGLKVSREITKLATDFDLSVTEDIAGDLDAWRLPVFAPIEIRLRGVTVLTGYIDAAFPSYDGRSKSIRIIGRSKTADLIDCSSELAAEFKATGLGAIARAVCAPFGISVVVETDLGEPFAIAAMEPTETAFQFLERLCRLRAVLATDDAQGRLVLTRGGVKPASGALWQGDNILALQVQHNVSKRFSRYIFKAQAPTAAATSWGGAEDDDEAQAPGGGAQPAVLGTATDAGVPRYRPRIFQAEQALTAAGAHDRALWQATHAAGQSIKALITVKDWTQPDGRLWQINEVIPVLSPWARIDDDLLITGVSYNIDAQGGRFTELECGPPGGYTPEPVKAKRAKTAGGAGGGSDWSDAGR